MNDELEILKTKIESVNDLSGVLKLLTQEFADGITFSSSFSEEDQVIYHAIARLKSNIEVFTLDTGRLFPETYSTWSQTLEKYHYPVKAFYPDQLALQDFVEQKGPNSFYESVENRKACCHIRKVEPLKRALQGKKVWITGIRAAHSANRHDMPMVEWDEAHQVIKVHPLLHWSGEDVKSFIKENQIPYNSLHDKGFVSIGCAPCTRAIKPGEDFRAGRWWWEDADKKECGLHVNN